MNELIVLDAPSNLGLRMPKPGVVPGCYKLASALRDCGLPHRIGASDAGAVVPPRYDISDWKPGDGVFNAAAIATYTERLAARVGDHVDAEDKIVLLGGDCSILLGPALALRHRGRYGVVYLDGHSDLRHTGNAPYVGAAGGEGLALITGRGQPDLTDLDGLGPYLQDTDAVVLGIREEDEYRDELAELGITSLTAGQVRTLGPRHVAGEALDRLAHLDGFWVHLDVDILDPSVMPAVDSPDPGGLDYAELVALLTPLLAAPAFVGVDVTIFDPDLDPDGLIAADLTDALVTAFAT